MSVSTLRVQWPEWFRPLLAPARYKAAYGGRGSGKSHGFAQLAIVRAATEKLDIVCIREVQKSLDQSVKKLLESKIAALNVGDYFEVQDQRILSRAGGKIIFVGMQAHTAESIKSLEGYGVAWIEEAQTLSQFSLDILRPTIRSEDSEMWFGWNPRQESDPVDAFLRGPSPYPGSIVVQANYTDNPWFPDVLRQEMEYDRGRDPDKYAHVWLGEYVRNSESRVFKNWRVEEFDIPPDAIIRQGADWGFASDPSVLVQCYIVGRTMYVPYEAYMVGCEINNLPELFLTLPGAEKWFITADSARPETISYMHNHGFPKIGAAVKGAKSVEEGVEWLKSFDIVVHPRCRHTIDELTLYSYKTDPLTGKVLPMLEDKHNHVVDALRYANEGARRAKPKEAPKINLVEPVGGPLGWMA